MSLICNIKYLQRLAVLFNYIFEIWNISIIKIPNGLDPLGVVSSNPLGILMVENVVYKVFLFSKRRITLYNVSKNSITTKI